MVLSDAIERARSALNVASQAGRMQHARSLGDEDFLATVRKRAHVERAAVPANQTADLSGADGVWAFMASLAGRSVLDAIKRYALILPSNANHFVLASGVVADEVAEGAPKAVSRANLSPESLTEKKVVGLVVASKKLLSEPSKLAEKMLRAELESAVIAASNTAAFSAINTTPATAAGDPVGDLEAGLAAAADSDGYVVAASPADTRALALASEGRMGVRGGDYLEGVTVVPVAGVTDMIIIPASRVVMKDDELLLRSSDNATVEMSASPGGQPTELVSMFQTNSRAILLERRFKIHSADDAVIVQ